MGSNADGDHSCWLMKVSLSVRDHCAIPLNQMFCWLLVHQLSILLYILLWSKLRAMRLSYVQRLSEPNKTQRHLNIETVSEYRIRRWESNVTEIHVMDFIDSPTLNCWAINKLQLSSQIPFVNGKLHTQTQLWMRQNDSTVNSTANKLTQ